MSTAFHDDDDRDDFDRHSIASSFMDMASPPAVQEDASEYSFYTHQRSATIQSFDSSTPILQPTNQKQRSASTNIRINTNRLSSYGSNGPKPPIPTDPKPIFNRSSSGDSSRSRPTPNSSQDARPSIDFDLLPPTTNYLNAQERAELIRKSRKLTKLFGQIPDALSVSPRQHEPPQRPFLSAHPSLHAKQHHHRPAASMSVGGEFAATRTPTKQDSRPSLRSSISSGSGRRHSTPLSPFDVASLSDLLSDSETDFRLPRDRSSIHSSLREGGDSTGRREAKRRDSHSRGMLDSDSFIDLSDEERSEGTHASSSRTPKSPVRFSTSPPWPPSPTSVDALSPEEQAEVERRRKRERLAKLHRFLGSRVPTSLVTGVNDPALPEPASSVSSSENEARPWRKLRRRSSSAAELKGAWTDRVKEDLDEREKAINVRRAIKMEKVFGELPPQTLYHTRHIQQQQPRSSDEFQQSPTRSSSDRSASLSLSSSPPGSRNMNQSAYYRKSKARPSVRHESLPSPSSSTRNLLLGDTTPIDGDPPSSHRHRQSQSSLGRRTSSIYMHYRHSLNSLNDIIDRDDRASLAELHQFLNTELPIVNEVTPTRTSFEPEVPVTASTPKFERRRSLPTKSSTLSLASQYEAQSPDPQMVSFQARRRRAAKLTNFFGVDYRELIGDILENIENGMAEESRRGSLHPDEMQDLMAKLRQLKVKRPTV